MSYFFKLRLNAKINCSSDTKCCDITIVFYLNCNEFPAFIKTFMKNQR